MRDRMISEAEAPFWRHVRDDAGRAWRGCRESGGSVASTCSVVRGGNAPSVRNGLQCPEVGAQGRNPALDGPAGLAYYEVALETRGTEHLHAPPAFRKRSASGCHSRAEAR